MFEERTLDLTAFNRANFAGVIRLRQLADWANDYYAKGLMLARIKLFEDEYRALVEEIKMDDRRIHAAFDYSNGSFNIDLGFGLIEIINVTAKEYEARKIKDAEELTKSLRKARIEAFKVRNIK